LADISNGRNNARMRDTRLNMRYGALHSFGIAVDQNHPGSFLAKQKPGRCPDPACAAGNDCCSVRKSSGHGFLLQASNCSLCRSS
jgi:hypothetical protein